MNILQEIKSYLTLEFVSSRFRDIVSGKMVCEYKDCYGNRFLKDSRYSFFKIEENK